MWEVQKMTADKEHQVQATAMLALLILGVVVVFVLKYLVGA